MHNSGMTSVPPLSKAQSDPFALFVSDVHLQEAMPRTTKTFLDFLSLKARKVQQLYLLGDLFEYWAGDDDVVSPYNQQIIDALRTVSDAGVAVFWIAGNRDFLIGKKFAQSAKLTLLPDPFVITLAGQRIVLTHGDAQCTDDHAYMAFRTKVRKTEWQKEFLSLSLAQRKNIIDGMRSGSKESQRAKAYEITDVNASAIASLFENTGTTLMIHGHTHRPAKHAIQAGGKTYVRYVLPDWDCDGKSLRGGWIGLGAEGSLQSFGLDDLPSQCTTS